MVTCDLFLMKILLKKEVCGSREQYTGPTRKMLDVQMLDACRYLNVDLVTNIDKRIIFKMK